MMPYWSFYMDTDEWQSAFFEIEKAETKEELKKNSKTSLWRLLGFIENFLGGDGRWAQEDMLVF